MKLGEFTVLIFVSTPSCITMLKCLKFLHHKDTIIPCDRTEVCSVLTPCNFVKEYGRFEGPCSFSSRLKETNAKMQMKGIGWTWFNCIFS